MKLTEACWLHKCVNIGKRGTDMGVMITSGLLGVKYTVVWLGLLDFVDASVNLHDPDPENDPLLSVYAKSHKEFLKNVEGGGLF